MSNPPSVCRSWAAGIPPAILIIFVLALAVMAGGSAASAASKYASIVVDQNSGRVLYSRSADAKRYPASLTKIMTLYMLFGELEAGRLKLDSRLSVSEYAASKPPSKIGVKPGQTIRVRDAIRSLVTKSANDVAAVVAENIGGSEANFAKMMTAKARAIGMTRTTFRNASGLPDSKQVTTARDMATLSRRIRLDYPEYYEFFSLKYFAYKGKKYRNHNGLLFNYKGTDGVKTGYIRASGFNLAASVKRGNKHLVAVVMGGKSAKARNQHIRHLFDKNWKRASTRRRLTPNRKVPMPLRNPLTPESIPVAKAPRPVATASLTAGLPSFRSPGITVDHTDPIKVLSGSEQGSREPTQRDGDYHVQVGAYSSQSEAIEQLSAVRKQAATLLDGHAPITMPVPKPKRYLYRARFAGFSETAARRTCSTLIARQIPCIVMRAE